MKPVDQTTFGAPGGNCLSACFASLLELPIEEVPYFGPADRIGTEEEWITNIAKWLGERGLYTFGFGYTPLYLPKGLHILGGMSPRGVPHSVVANAGQMVHDPHPSRAGLTRLEHVMLLVPFDPKGGLR